MAGVAEGLARVVSDIAAGRLARSKFEAEVRVETNERRNDVESFLKNANSTRSEAAREQAENGRKAVMALHADVGSFLLGAQTARREAGAAPSGRARPEGTPRRFRARTVARARARACALPRPARMRRTRACVKACAWMVGWVLRSSRRGKAAGAAPRAQILGRMVRGGKWYKASGAARARTAP